MPSPQTIIIIAHTSKILSLAKLINKHRDVFDDYRLLSLTETGEVIENETGLEVTHIFSAKKGGEMQLCGLICSNVIRCIFFLRDPLNQDPAEPDITPFYRACDLNNVPLATNMVGAVALLSWLGRKSAEGVDEDDSKPEDNIEE